MSRLRRLAERLHCAVPVLRSHPPSANVRVLAWALVEAVLYVPVLVAGAVALAAQAGASGALVAIGWLHERTGALAHDRKVQAYGEARERRQGGDRE